MPSKIRTSRKDTGLVEQTLDRMTRWTRDIGVKNSVTHGAGTSRVVGEAEQHA